MPGSPVLRHFTPRGSNRRLVRDDPTLSLSPFSIVALQPSAQTQEVVYGTLKLERIPG